MSTNELVFLDKQKEDNRCFALQDNSKCAGENRKNAKNLQDGKERNSRQKTAHTTPTATSR